MLKDKKFDVVVLGSGLGGATAAYSLSKAGFRVLVLERGRWPHRDQDDWNANKILLRSRYFGPDQIGVKQYDSKNFEPTSFNENVGGMSVFYGGAAFRLREKDFDQWPVSYRDFSKAYLEAERLLEVHGKAFEDPTEPPRDEDYPFPPIPLNPPAERIFRAACKLEAKPFHIPLAINFKNQSRTQSCIQCHTCDGYPCKIAAKNDATLIIQKAQRESNNLELITGVIVDRLEWKNDRVQSVHIVDTKTGEKFRLESSLFILAAGALGSPPILLRSHLEAFPHSRKIGKNLMRHCNAIVSYVFPFKTNPNAVFHKQIAISAFYEDWRNKDGRATGIIQDIYTPERKVVSAFAPKGVKWIAGALSEHIQSLLCVAEDDAQETNRIELSERVNEFGIRLPQIQHQYSTSDLERLDYLISKARKILKSAGGKISRLMRIDSFSHAVGTIRFGRSPVDSVLDENCQFFGLKNLYVMDGSFMPSSGGVNPSLSITANALRASSKVVERKDEWLNSHQA